MQQEVAQGVSYMSCDNGFGYCRSLWKKRRLMGLMMSALEDFLCHVRLLEAAEPGQLCAAEPWGYTAPPIDIFACAVAASVSFSLQEDEMLGRCKEV